MTRPEARPQGRDLTRATVRTLARPAIRAVHVVVPVRDEELVLGGCLGAVAISVGRARVRRPDLIVQVTVVLDRCRDASAAIARACDVRCLEVQAGAVGAARASGVASTREWLVATGRVLAAEEAWVATTDADSRVPPGWLEEHLDLADRGHGLVVGPVGLDPAEVEPSLRMAWEQAHPAGADAVYGANLGFRLSDYELVGGFAPVREHEDVGLVAAMTAAGVPRARSTLPVTTSGRTVGRTPGGFAGYLRDLVAACAPAGTHVPEPAAPG